MLDETRAVRDVTVLLLRDVTTVRDVIEREPLDQRNTQPQLIRSHHSTLTTNQIDSLNNVPNHQCLYFGGKKKIIKFFFFFFG